MKEILLRTEMHQQKKAECSSCSLEGGHWQGWGEHTERLGQSVSAESSAKYQGLSLGPQDSLEKSADSMELNWNTSALCNYSVCVWGAGRVGRRGGGYMIHIL